MNLITRDGEEKQAEIIVSFKIEGYNGDYVIYKIGNDYFGAKYKNMNNSSELITDLSIQEKILINNFYSVFQKEGERND